MNVFCLSHYKPKDDYTEGLKLLQALENTFTFANIQIP